MFTCLKVYMFNLKSNKEIFQSKIKEECGFETFCPLSPLLARKIAKQESLSNPLHPEISHLFYPLISDV